MLWNAFIFLSHFICHRPAHCQNQTISELGSWRDSLSHLTIRPIVDSDPSACAGSIPPDLSIHKGVFQIDFVYCKLTTSRKTCSPQAASRPRTVAAKNISLCVATWEQLAAAAGRRQPLFLGRCALASRTRSDKIWNFGCPIENLIKKFDVYAIRCGFWFQLLICSCPRQSALRPPRFWMGLRMQFLWQMEFCNLFLLYNFFWIHTLKSNAGRFIFLSTLIRLWCTSISSQMVCWAPIAWGAHNS